MFYKELRTEFKEAERRLKLIEREHISEGLDIPSVNELRYVAYHLLEALDGCASEQVQTEAICKAIRHCKRASFDAIELGLLSTLESIKEFKDDYKKVSITSVLPNIVTIFTEVEAHKMILDTNDEHKHEKYLQAEASYLELIKISKKLEAARDELNKIKVTTWQEWLQRSLAAIGALAVIATLIHESLDIAEKFREEPAKLSPKAITEPK